MNGKQISGKKLGIVPVLRAGLGMVQGMLNLIPMAKVGHIGLYRDPQTLEPVEYYCKLPDVENRDFIIVDPMLATGGSASAAITLLKEKGIKNIKLMCLVAAPQGVQKVNADHPDVRIYVAALDDTLNDQGYIVPVWAMPATVSSVRNKTSLLRTYKKIASHLAWEVIFCLLMAAGRQALNRC